MPRRSLSGLDSWWFGSCCWGKMDAGDAFKPLHPSCSGTVQGSTQHPRVNWSSLKAVLTYTLPTMGPGNQRTAHSTPVTPPMLGGRHACPLQSTYKIIAYCHCQLMGQLF